MTQQVVTARDEGEGAPPSSPVPGPAGQRIERRRVMPGGRAVVGGFLVAVAVVGVFGAHRRVTTVAERSFVVAARAIEPGTQLSASHLTTVRIPDGGALEAAGLFTDPRALLGAHTVGPIGAGEFVQATAVVRRAGPADAHEVSLAIEPARAVGGDLHPGERVHVVATFGVGADAYTAVVVHAAHVVAVHGGGSSLTDARLLTVTLAVPTGDDALAIAHAVDAGKLTLVRAGATEPSGPYRASAA